MHLQIEYVTSWLAAAQPDVLIKQSWQCLRMGEERAPDGGAPAVGAHAGTSPVPGDIEKSSTPYY